MCRPPDHAPSPAEATPEESHEHARDPETNSTPSKPIAEDSHPVTTQIKSVEGGSLQIPQPEADLPSHGATTTSRLNGIYVKSAFQQLKTADGEIQAGIAEAVASQLETDETSKATTFAAKREMTAAKLGDLLGASEQLDAPEVAEYVLRGSEPVREAVVEESATTVSDNAPEAPHLAISDQAATPGSTQVQEGARKTSAEEFGSIPLSDAQEMMIERELSQPESIPPFEDNLASEAPETTPTPTSGEETVSPEVAAPKPAAAPESAAVNPTHTPSAAPAMPRLDNLAQSSPEQIASLMAYLQQLQAAKAVQPSQATAPQPATPNPVSEQRIESRPTTSEASVPDSPGAEAIASMTAPIEPSGQQVEAQVQEDSTSETSSSAPSELSRIATPAQDTMLDSSSAEFKPAITTTEPYGAIPLVGDVQITQPESQSSSEAMLNTATAETEQADVEGSAADEMSADDFAARRAALEAELSSPGGQATETASEDALSETSENPSAALEAVVDAELSEKVEAAAAAGQDVAPPKPVKKQIPQAKRLPRNVQAYYLQPLRRVAEYGVPSCDLQLRSYNVRPLESFCDFALRAAYYLGLPAFGPTPLPKVIERWTVPKSVFIHKKSQENFERITRRRLIQIKDGHPETVQIWLAFLQKHQQAAVGMKANMWEFSSLGKSPSHSILYCCNVLGAIQ